MTNLPADFAWHQSCITTMLACPKRFKFRFVDCVPLDHTASDYAHILGTADHAGIELILLAANEGRTPARAELLDYVMEAFQDALFKAQENGESTNPDDLDRTVDRIEGERVERLLLLANDPRIRAIDWKGIEWPFKFTDASGRYWQGTLDAWGVARRNVLDFGKLGRDWVGLRSGDGVLSDWKTGMEPPFGFVERAQSVQLGIYGMALNRTHPGRWRTFLGLTEDLDHPKAPSDADGNRIPKKLPKVINPAFMKVTNLGHDEALSSKRKPRVNGESVLKWLPEQINPEWQTAVDRPKGPFFREAVVDYGLVLETVRAVIRQAEAGIFPASGAATGQCGRCAYATVCTSQRPTEETS